MLQKQMQNDKKTTKTPRPFVGGGPTNIPVENHHFFMGKSSTVTKWQFSIANC